MKFLVPNYSCLQNPWLGATAPRTPFSLSYVFNLICWTPPPPNKTPGYATDIYNDTKYNQKNLKEYDKRNRHISSKLHMINISSNNDSHPVTKTFTQLHCTSPNYTLVPLHYTCWHNSFPTFRNSAMPSSSSVVYVSVKHLSCLVIVFVDRSVSRTV